MNRDAVEVPKPFVPDFVVANDVRTIDYSIQDVINASRNLNAETSRHGVILERPLLAFIQCSQKKANFFAFHDCDINVVRRHQSFCQVV